MPKGQASGSAKGLVSPMVLALALAPGLAMEKGWQSALGSAQVLESAPEPVLEMVKARMSVLAPELGSETELELATAKVKEMAKRMVLAKALGKHLEKDLRLAQQAVAMPELQTQANSWRSESQTMG